MMFILIIKINIITEKIVVHSTFISLHSLLPYYSSLISPLSFPFNMYNLWSLWQPILLFPLLCSLFYSPIDPGCWNYVFTAATNVLLLDSKKWTRCTSKINGKEMKNMKEMKMKLWNVIHLYPLWKKIYLVEDQCI